MLKRFFITGTDRRFCRKTVVSAHCYKRYLQGKTVAGYKPVAKGSKETPEGLVYQDTLVLQSVSTSNCLMKQLILSR